MKLTIRKEKSIIHQQFFETMIALSLLELSRGITCIFDGIMTSHLVGSEKLAAFGIAAPYFSIMAIASILLTIGCQTMYTQNLGKGDLDRANAYLSHAVLYGVIIAGLLTVAGIVFVEPLCVLFGARGNSAFLLPDAKEYLIGLMIGTAGNVLLAILHPIVELDGGKLWTKLASFTLIVVNIAGNYITTRWLNLGLFGIGISSSLGFIAAAAVLSLHFFSKKCQIRFKINKENRISLTEFLKIGYPGAVSMLCRAICPIVVNGMIVAISSADGLSAISAQANIKFVIGAPLCGIAGAVMELGSIAYGERDTLTLRKILNISYQYIFIGVTLFSALVFLCAPLLASCYFPEGSQEYRLTLQAMRYYSISLVFTGFNLAIISYFQLIEKRKPLLTLYICNELMGVALFTVIFGKIFGISGIFAAIAAGPAAISLLCFPLFFLRKKGKAKSALPCLSDDFGVPEEKCLQVTVKTMDEVMDSSRKIQQFCSDHGIDSKKAFYAAVLIEELAGNVIEHGFTDGKNHQVDLRIVAEENEIIFKIADNCRRFDFNKKVKLLRENAGNPEKYLGLKLALGLTRNITYLNVSNKNILIFTI